MATLISIGTDSEIFARDKDGKAIALCGKIGGSKEAPKPLANIGRGFFVQEDNVSMEFNIPPCSTYTEWDTYIDVTLKELERLLKTMSLYFTPDASISFSKDQLIHPNALVFGCEPDFNAWTKMENEKPMCNDPSLRTAGGHVHVGTRGNMIQCVEKMDLYLGVPSVILDASPASVNRRSLYGKAGAMRPKPYGFEYRVLSNFWIFKKELRNWVFFNTKRAVEDEHPLTGKLSYQIQECINTGNKDLAKEIINKYGIPMPSDKASVVEENHIYANRIHRALSIDDLMMMPPISTTIGTGNNGTTS